MNNPIFVEYLPLEDNPKATHLKVQLYYDLGGYNYFTYNAEPRGYYMSASPVCHSEHCESYTAFTGNKLCILEVPRKSKKAEEQAKALFDEQKDIIIRHTLIKNNLTLKEEK